MQFKLMIELSPAAERLLGGIVVGLAGMQGASTGQTLAATGTTGPKLVTSIPESIPRAKKGRPTKEEVAAREAAAAGAVVAPAKKKKAAPVEEEDAEETEEEDETEEVDEDDAEEEDDDDEEEEADEDDEEKVAGEDLKKLKAALKKCSDSIGKAKAVKILLGFAKTSDQVKASDLPALLKKLKVPAKAA